jgi:uncharacterized protein YjbI with pentapeptide repeats
MANEEHLAILRQGVDVWNAWRKANPDVRAYLPGVNLNSANLTTADLRIAYLSGADLTKADLSNTDLRNTNLTKADLSRANLSEAKIFATVFGDHDLSDVTDC